MAAQNERRVKREQLLLELTAAPTAAGREGRVVAFLERWVADRPGLELSKDATGNLWIGAERERRAGAAGGGLIVFEAHLDHPAFVVDEVVSEREARASFRGGVRAAYFEGARVVLHGDGDGSVGGRVGGRVVSSEPADEKAGRLFRVARIEFEEAAGARVGDVLTWDLPSSVIEDGFLRAPVCDDLAAATAALCALEELCASEDREAGDGAHEHPDVRVLLTRAEEVGFVGAIAACRNGTIPPGARVLALENSRSFADSPLGAGPIVRVGDRLSVFSPALTAAVAKIAQRLAGEEEKEVGSAGDGKKTGETPVPPGSSKTGETMTDTTCTGQRPAPPFRWQRKLMPGGACEATAFCAFGHEATCVCLPLRNYHNMGRLDEVEAAEKAGSWEGSAPIEPETISVADFHNLVELLVACGRGLGGVEPMTVRLEKMYAQRRFVLDG